MTSVRSKIWIEITAVIFLAISLPLMTELSVLKHVRDQNELLQEKEAGLSRIELRVGKVEGRFDEFESDLAEIREELEKVANIIICEQDINDRVSVFAAVAKKGNLSVHGIEQRQTEDDGFCFDRRYALVVEGKPDDLLRFLLGIEEQPLPASVRQIEWFSAPLPLGGISPARKMRVRIDLSLFCWKDTPGPS